MAVEGVVTVASNYGPGETLARLKAEIASRGLTLFAAVDHAKNAKDVGLSLRPTTVLIFGSAKAGTPLMQATQLIGIDLPLKSLVWQDANGATWISYHDPVWLAARHGLPPELQPSAAAMRGGLEAITKTSAGTP